MRQTIRRLAPHRSSHSGQSRTKGYSDRRSIPAALKNCFSWLDELLVQVPLPCPSARKIAQTIIVASRKIPCARSNLLNDKRSRSSVLYLRGALENPCARIGLIFQLHVNISRHILEQNGQTIARNRVRHILQHEITIAIRKSDLQVGLYVKPATPCCEVLPGRVDRGVE